MTLLDYLKNNKYKINMKHIYSCYSACSSCVNSSIKYIDCTDCKLIHNRQFKYLVKI